MSRKDGQYSKETADRAEQIYLANPDMSLSSLSERSSSLLGEHVPLNRLKNWSSERRWSVKRSGLPLEQASVAEEVKNIRNIIYRQIVAESESGLLLSGDFDKEEVKSLLSDVDELNITEISPRGVDAALINAYMNLLAKSNADIAEAGKSAKTTHQQALEMAREALAEVGR